MRDLFNNLSDLIADLKDAYSREAWDEISTLDSSVQHIVGTTEKSLTSQQDRAAFQEKLLSLQSLYDQIAADHAVIKQELGTELKKLHKEHNAISQYLQSSSYQ